jgi:hypothetical protein
VCQITWDRAIQSSAATEQAPDGPSGIVFGFEFEEFVVMRARSLVVSCAALAALAVGAVPASAHTPRSHLHGYTKVTIAPAITRALLGAGILPVVTRPGDPGLAFTGGGATVTATYPITGGHLATSPLGGLIDHRGGLEFINLANSRHIEVEDFVIDLDHGDLTGLVAGTTLRVPVFTLDLSKAKVRACDGNLDASQIGLNLTAVAAGALDKTLATTAFTPGLTVGTAATDVDR